MIKVSGELEFDAKSNRRAAELKGGEEWPVVYILSNEEEAYVGETVNAYARLAQHYENPERRRLKSMRLITDDTFNKSVALDLESFLISHMSADSRFEHLQNGNAGQQKHNYYQKDIYEAQFQSVWKQLQALGLATKTINEIENSNLFKYSPYKSLTSDQYLTCFRIIETLAKNVRTNQRSSFLVEGGPGTGKTILAIYLMRLLTSPVDEDMDSEDESVIEELRTIHASLPNFRVGLVLSMANLRTIVKDVFKVTYGLNANMVLRPSEVANSPEEFDLLIVDEAHRLKTSRNLGAEIGSFYKNNERLGFNKSSGTQLDWILQKSKNQIFFYDAGQTIKRTDVDKQRFDELRSRPDCQVMHLTTQMRCGADGQAYVDYIKSIFSNCPPRPRAFQSYDVRLFDNVRAMTEAIKQKDSEVGIGLCRNLAGYSWPWVTKGKLRHNSMGDMADTQSLSQGDKFDIEIDGEKYVWNTEYDGWIGTENSVNEIGCIHTIQGLDLNYAGVIIGNDLRYNEETGRFYVDRDSYFDRNGKIGTDDAVLLQYILNIYIVLCTRGMRGTYIYACDKGLRNYLRKFFR